jgi:hypothetical protein
MPTMLPHPRWRRFWALWASAVLISGIGLDTVAYVRHGWRATLTASIRRWGGVEPHAAHGRLGQAILLGFFAWLGVHLTFGVLGPNRGRFGRGDDCSLIVPTIVDPPFVELEGYVTLSA